MRKRNHTVTIRMNKEEYDLFQSKVKESGRTQQEVVIKAIADLKIATAEEIEELKRLNQMFADILCQLRGATTNINQIARKLHTDEWKRSVYFCSIQSTGSYKNPSLQRKDFLWGHPVLSSPPGK